MVRGTQRPTASPRARVGPWLVVTALSLLVVGSCGPSAASAPAAPAGNGDAAAARSAPAAPAAQPAAPAEAPLQPQSVVVRMDWIPWATHAPMHLAVERGWFAERGLDVELQNGTGSVSTVQAVGAGRFELGWASLATMAIAREENLPVRSIAGVVRRSDLGMMYASESGIRGPKDLEGKTLVTSPASLEQPFIEPFLRKNGANPDRVTVLALDPAAKLQTFMAGRGGRGAGRGSVAVAGRGGGGAGRGGAAAPDDQQAERSHHQPGPNPGARASRWSLCPSDHDSLLPADPTARSREPRCTPTRGPPLGGRDRRRAPG